MNTLPSDFNMDDYRTAFMNTLQGTFMRNGLSMESPAAINAAITGASKVAFAVERHLAGIRASDVNFVDDTEAVR